MQNCTVRFESDLIYTPGRRSDASHFCERFLEKHVKATSGHQSCDKANCESVRREAELMMRGKASDMCLQFLVFEPRDTCWKNNVCQEDPDAKTSTQPRQVMVAFIKLDVLLNEQCSDAYGEISVGVDNTCDSDGCKRAREDATVTLKRRIKKKYPGCVSYVDSVDLRSCVQYDCL